MRIYIYELFKHCLAVLLATAQESAQAALTYTRSVADKLGVNPQVFENVDIHIHVPAGATPKDGPSAGIAIATALISVLTDTPVNKDVAMTGEITLRGEVLPIGGLKEKLLAAHRGGISIVLIPEENRKDLAEIPKNVKDKLDIRPVRWIDQVLEVALTHQPTPLAEAGPKQATAKTSKSKTKPKDKPLRAH